MPLLMVLGEFRNKVWKITFERKKLVTVYGVNDFMICAFRMLV
jgi:hypothetical protein